MNRRGNQALALTLFFCSYSAPTAFAQYVESNQTWSATSASTWQTQNLSGSPFNVPANAIVEVVVENADVNDERSGGVRAFGSSLDRRFLLRQGLSSGRDIVTMHVQTDGSSRIEHYAEDTTEVTFRLLGYWESGTYVERFDAMTAGADASWQDQNLSGFGVSAGEIAEVVGVHSNNSNELEVGMRTNGSSLARIIDLAEANAGGVDAVTMFVLAEDVANATIELYAEVDADVDFTLVGYWTSPPAPVYVEAFTDIGAPSSDGTWEDNDLTGDGVPNNAVVEIAFLNEAISGTVIGLRANGPNLGRLFAIADTTPGAGFDGTDAVRFHVLTDSSAIIEVYSEDVSDTPNIYLLGYWQQGISDHVAGQETDAFTQSAGETNAELLGFTISPLGSITITQIVFRLSNIRALNDSDWAGIEILVDDDDDGNIGAGETTTVGGSGTVNTAAGTVTFTTSFSLSSSTSYILRADFATLLNGDRFTITLNDTDVTGTSVTGGTNAVQHTELTLCYIVKHESWSATSANTWQTKDLAASPFSVPANAIVEVAVQNKDSNVEHSGGVRAVGSGLNRRLTLQEADGTGSNEGSDFLVMHVQTDASSDIQHYSGNTAELDFILLGYWQCGTYVEAFDTFTAGASTSWEDVDLCAFGVGPDHVAEIVMTNDDPNNELEAGVRTKGSGLQRRLDLHEPEDGGVDTATMFVQADSSASATVQVYAEVDANIDFYHVGYWSVAPAAYTELFVDVGSPASDATWEDIDLTADGVTDDGIAEFVLANEADAAGRNMGLRQNGNTTDRFLDLHEAEDGGSEIARMHITADDVATIEFYHEDVSEAHTFRLVGNWDFCDESVSYTVADLGAVTAANDSLGQHINASGDVAGFEEDGSGDPDSWFSECESFSALGVLGGSDAEALGINDAEMVVGWSDDGSGNRRAFTWTSGGGLVNLGTIAGWSDSEAHAVNASSEVVGTVLDFGSPPERRMAFIYLPSPAYTLGAGMTDLGTLGGLQSVAMDINDSGQVTGGAQSGTGQFLRNMRPFRWANGTFTNLGTLGGESESILHRGEAINASGNVAGMSFTAGGDAHAFYWDGSMTDLGVLTGGDTSWAQGINDSNVVVGTSNVSGGAFHAFVWDSTNGMRDLNDLDGASGWTLIRATDINNDGRITGWGTNGSGDYRAFQLTPSCTGGGGGAVASVAFDFVSSGSVTSDSQGTVDEVILNPAGQVLGEIVVETDRTETFEYQVTESRIDSTSGPGLRLGTFDGFVDEVALPRTLSVTSGARPDSFKMTVYFSTHVDELATVGLQPDDAQLYVLDTSKGTLPGQWKPAGVAAGETESTGVIGESGFEFFTDGSVDYWAVRTKSGIFAVGKASFDNDDEPIPDDDPPPPPSIDNPGPAMCGVGMLLPLFVGFTGYFVGRRGIRTANGDQSQFPF